VLSKVKILSQPVYGRVTNYRIGIRTQYLHEYLLQFAGVDSVAQTGPLMGQKVVWKSGKKMLIGKIVGFHGNNVAVRAKFKKGVHGQALGTTIELVR